MKNKEITIYELMGLIKDDKAPKKIKYNGKEYYYNFGDYYSVKDINLFNNIELKLKSIRELLDVTIEILPEKNDEWEDIEDITLNGEVVGYGILEKWLDFTPNDNEQKICSCIETLGIVMNRIIKNQKHIIEKLESKDEK